MNETTDYNKLFKNEKNNPSAWNLAMGKHSAFMFDSIVFNRDEKEIVKAAKANGFNMFKFGKIVLFRI